MIDRELTYPIREYVRTYALLYGRNQAAEEFGISRHTLWRFLERGHMGRALPRAALKSVGMSADAPSSGTVKTLKAATQRLIADLVRQSFAPPLTGQHDVLGWDYLWYINEE